MKPRKVKFCHLTRWLKTSPADVWSLQLSPLQVSRFSPYEWKAEDPDEDETLPSSTSQRVLPSSELPHSAGLALSAPSHLIISTVVTRLSSIWVFCSVPQGSPRPKTTTSRKKKMLQNTPMTLGSLTLCGSHWGPSCSRAVTSPPGNSGQELSRSSITVVYHLDLHHVSGVLYKLWKNSTKCLRSLC